MKVKALSAVISLILTAPLCANAQTDISAIEARLNVLEQRATAAEARAAAAEQKAARLEQLINSNSLSQERKHQIMLQTSTWSNALLY